MRVITERLLAIRIPCAVRGRSGGSVRAPRPPLATPGPRGRSALHGVALTEVEIDQQHENRADDRTDDTDDDGHHDADVLPAGDEQPGRGTGDQADDQQTDDETEHDDPLPSGGRSPGVPATVVSSVLSLTEPAVAGEAVH